MTSKLKETTLSSKEIYTGKVIKVIKDQVELSNGLKKTREVVKHPGGVVVAAFTDDNKILFVKQYRYPIKQELIELPAGKLEYGENPDEAIKRELIEECGYTAKRWERLACAVSTPGFCDEKLYLYKAEELVKGEREIEEGELLENITFTPEEAMEMIRQQKITDLKTIALLGLVLQ
jgi:ADP-ribose pyrophosphatase